MGVVSLRILMQVLPLTIVFCGLKFGIHQLGWELWVFDGLTGSLFSAAIFVLAIVLSGTLSDYRSSEGLPSQIANALETMQDSNLLMAKVQANYDAKGLQSAIDAVARSILAWLHEGQSVESVETGLNQLNEQFSVLHPLEGGLLVIHRMQTELSKVRLLVRQIQTTRDTNFVPAAYVLLILFLIASAMSLLIIRSDSFSENLVTSGFLFTSLAYLFLFIRDLDNPFSYDGKSCVDVDLGCLQKLSDRLS
jgi:hypothetical protein